MASKALTYNDYTVGWVCALSKEQTAATAMLDEEHEDLPKPPNDHNTYTLGRIGKHNIVIACLPEGEIGNNAAATVATRMTSTFPSIKFGLMVGIGGGVPPTVRLGDVVVSTPADGFGGVVQWDLGKAEQDDTFKRTGALDSPPTALRTVLTKLKTKHEMKGSMISQYLEDLKTNWPRLAAKYTRSESLEDVLFRADYNHVEKYAMGDGGIPDNAGEVGTRDDKDSEEEDEKEEEGCTSCDRSKIVRRKARKLRVHYGLIASSNQVIKDATFRDKVNKKLGGRVLCFEMEAAGLMNDFPCIVIRGICDYADSHKNKAWQEHAAAVAAAFTKEFLLMVPVYEVDQLPTIANVLDAITKVSTDLEHATIHANHEAILKWLSDIDPSLNYNKAREQRTPTTGGWFVKSQSYAEWIEGKVSMLWLHGIPGCGKTVISSMIIESLLENHLTDPKANIAYFYFDFSDLLKQTVEGCLRSLLRHLSARELPAIVEALHKQAQERNAQPGLDALTDTLKAVLQQAPLTFLIFDALDECKEVKRLMEKIAEIKRWELPSVRILATSRREPDITKAMDVLARPICLETEFIDEDIKTFVKQSLRSDGPLERWSKDAKAKQEIEDALAAGSNGMFRWAQCQLDALGKCLSRPMLRKVLASLPKTLDDTYVRILCNIDEEYSKDALRILQWLTYNARPLQIEELVDVIAVDTEGDPRFDPENRLKEPRDVLKICSSLVATAMEATDGPHGETAGEQVKLAHFSVKEYLVSNRITGGPAHQYSIREIQANMSIAEICLAYLLQFDNPDSLTSQTIKEYPLALYAAKYWTQHARVAGENENVMDRLIMELFMSKKDAYVNSVRLFDPENIFGGPDVTKSSESVAPPLYYASLTGLIEAVRLLLEEGADVNAQGGGLHGTALRAASAGGHGQIVQRLLENGADVNAKGRLYGSALQVASAGGHGQIVQRLLQNGADVNARGRLLGTALQAASAGGHDQIVQRLLENVADVNAQGARYGTALQAASAGGHDQIVQRLLQNGADVNTREGGLYGSALQAASAGGHDQIVQWLLQNGADVNAQGGEYGTALQAASACGRDQIVQRLLQNGADVNAQGGEYGTALQAASLNGHDQIVQRLKSAVQSQSYYF